MTDTQLPSPTDSSDALTFLEKLVSVRLLILALALVFYMDIWALRAGVDPMTLTAEQLGRHLQSVPVFKLGLFFVSFSILMGAFFPALRVVWGAVALYFGKGGRWTRERRSMDAKRLSDWSLGLVALSSYDAVVGWLAEGKYTGLAQYLTHLLELNSLEIVLFRLTTAVFWFICLALSFEIDI